MYGDFGVAKQLLLQEYYILLSLNWVHILMDDSTIFAI
jgi:hypothetical protein